MGRVDQLELRKHTNQSSTKYARHIVLDTSRRRIWASLCTLGRWIALAAESRRPSRGHS